MLSRINKNNKKYMDIAFALAKERVGLTGTNPSVGCVIVKNNQILSFGQTGYGGKPHAEVNAINNCKYPIKNSSIYISLEPCSHFGKTPPCTQKIIKSKIKYVFYGLDDIDERSSNKSKKILSSKKIFVKKNFLKKTAKKIYKSYFFLKSSELPYITGKIACSKNYMTVFKKRYISNDYSLGFSHILRKKNQGILISHKTLNNDDPILNCRLNGLDKFTPKRFILDKNLNININSLIVKTSKIYSSYVFYNKKNNKSQILKKNGLKLIKCPLDINKKLDLKYILKKIRKLNIDYLLVEGGKNLSEAFLNKNLFNEFYIFKSDKLSKKNSSQINSLISKLKNSFKNKKEVDFFTGNDVIKRYY